MTNAEGLKPCPFCGGEATLERACLVRDTYHWVTCRNELCVVKCHGFQSLTARDAIAAWNRRAAVAQQPAPADAVERASKLLSGWLSDGDRRWFKPHDDLRDRIAIVIAEKDREIERLHHVCTTGLLAAGERMDQLVAEAQAHRPPDSAPDGALDELRQRNSDLSYMAGERDILLAAVERIIDYDDGTKMIMGECSSIADQAKADVADLRNNRQPLPAAPQKDPTDGR